MVPPCSLGLCDLIILRSTSARKEPGSVNERRDRTYSLQEIPLVRTIGDMHEISPQRARDGVSRTGMDQACCSRRLVSEGWEMFGELINDVLETKEAFDVEYCWFCVKRFSFCSWYGHVGSGLICKWLFVCYAWTGGLYCYRAIERYIYYYKISVLPTW